jgi:hypothetical protein
MSAYWGKAVVAGGWFELLLVAEAVEKVGSIKLSATIVPVKLLFL